jgi:curli biogenesis system outer membrane secretion channel CsgG
MKLTLTAMAGTAVLGLAACTTVTTQAPASSPPASSRAAASSSATSRPQTTPAPPPSSAAPSTTTPSTPGPPTPGAQAAAPNVTDPWAVVSAYYGDIESGNYAQAWALLNSGATTGQTYQQFVNGFACTGSQVLSEVGESGDQVTFNLDATDSCTGQVQHFTGTDTVQNGKIVAANVARTG